MFKMVMRGVLLLWCMSTVVPAGAQSKASDYQAVALARTSYVALTSGTVITDVTLTASVASIDGSDTDTGTATLLAKGNARSRLDLNTSEGTRSEVRNVGTDRVPVGKRVDFEGRSYSESTHNCWGIASWFFPHMSPLYASDPSIVVKYVGLESRKGVSVHHLRTYGSSPTVDSSAPASLKSLGAVDYYLDASTFLPVAIQFNVHPDNDALNGLLVEVDFSDYRPTNGVLVPTHVLRFQQGNLMLDIRVTSSIINTGLSDSQFAVEN
jgi:hypothetical protein